MDNIICTFDKAQYLTGADIRIQLPPHISVLQLRLFQLARCIDCPVQRKGDELVLRGLPEGNYGVLIETSSGGWEGAFDIVSDQRKITRYGFLADFSLTDGGIDDVAWMRDLHLNAVQFYDWMYRHDSLLPDSDCYQDPLGRDLNLSVIRKKAEACKAFGMRPFAYGAIYAATHETFQKHPEWGMYTMDGKPLMFAGWLHFMNIAAGCGWTDHLLRQYQDVISFGFSGIHMDTYGFPKLTWDVSRRPVELSGEFAGLIDRASSSVCAVDKNAGVIFNAVNNWPVEAVAGAAQDAIYIEVWPPNDTYHDLYKLIRDAKRCADKPVILAAYIKPFQFPDTPAAERALRLAWAAISASGGTHLVFGEGNGALQDSYYVNYAHLRREFAPVAQKYCDFLVRYADLMYNDIGSDISKTASSGINEDVCFAHEQYSFTPDGAENTVWTILRESSVRLTIHLINLVGNSAAWNEGKNTPREVNDIQIRLRLDRPVQGIYCASPDSVSLCAQALPFSYEITEQGRVYSFRLSGLQYWKAVWVEWEK